MSRLLEEAKDELMGLKLKHKRDALSRQLARIEDIEFDLEMVKDNLSCAQRELEALEKMDIDECFRTYCVDGSTGIRRLNEKRR
jgi:hypothetical protein